MKAEMIQSSGKSYLSAVAALGIVWNAYGLYQFIGSLRQTKESLMGIGMNGTAMTASQAELYLSLPAWISAAFAIGVLGGLAGSVALLMRKAIARPILAASLAGYVLLFVGDMYHGVFASMPSQTVILAFVVAIAAALLWVAQHARKQSLLA